LSPEDEKDLHPLADGGEEGKQKQLSKISSLAPSRKEEKQTALALVRRRGVDATALSNAEKKGKGEFSGEGKNRFSKKRPFDV